MAVRLDHNSLPGVSYRALALLTAGPSGLHCIANPVSGGDSGGETPVPIPNTAVKPSSADGTARSPCGRVGRRRILFGTPGSGLVGVGLAWFEGMRDAPVPRPARVDRLHLPGAGGRGELHAHRRLPDSRPRPARRVRGKP